MSTSKAPSGLTLTRSGLGFTASWKRGATYASQEFRWRFNGNGVWSGWGAVKIAKGATSQYFALPVTSFFPFTTNGLIQVQFAVRGKVSGKTASAWVYKEFVIDVPVTPTVSAELDGTYLNKTKFTYSAETSDSDSRHYYDTVMWTAKVNNFTSPANIPENAWSVVGSVGTSGSREFTDDIPIGTSMTRVVRVASRGARGQSAYAYAYHTYATPKAPTITGCNGNIQGDKTYMSVKWRAQHSAAYPIDSLSLQYAIGTPGAGMASPSSGWTDGGTIAYTQPEQSYEMFIDGKAETDECVWARVTSTHDKASNYSEPVRVYAGKLAAPTLTEADASGKRISVNADHNSDVSDSFILVSIGLGKNPSKWYDIGVLPHNVTNDTFDCPDVEANPYTVKIVEYTGTYSYVTSAEGYRSYSVSAAMRSDEISSSSGSMAKPPATVKAEQYDSSTIRLEWDWTWETANAAGLSWSTNPNAWESTDEPTGYEVDHKATSWYIAGLKADQTYYVRVRLIYSGENTVHSAWSSPVAVTLSSELSRPAIAIENPLINIEDDVICTCSYSSSKDVRVQVAEMIDDNVSENAILGTFESSSVKLSIDEINKAYEASGMDKWDTGTSHFLVCRLISDGGATEWSETAAVSIIPSLNEPVLDTGLLIKEKQSQGTVYYEKTLEELPFTVRVVSDAAVHTNIIISRMNDYNIFRPDEKNEERFAGEIVMSLTSNGDGSFEITKDNLIGSLDDGTWYRVTATITDAYGQHRSKSDEIVVHWKHQPTIPVVSSATDTDKLVSKITVTKPSGYVNGDCFDLYRLSADLPELIVANGTYGTTYVDPYPAFNENGGHRIVNKTVNGDYITADDTFAWTDIGIDDGDCIKNKKAVIDFDGRRVEFSYNIDISNSWSKDFKQTTYLGGSITGDWNPAVTRGMSVSTVHINTIDDETIENIRRLAVWPGICHIRTPDGSSFACDVQVSEDRSHDSPFVNSFSLSINRVDPEGFEGVTLDEWNDNNDSYETEEGAAVLDSATLDSAILG